VSAYAGASELVPSAVFVPAALETFGGFGAGATTLIQLLAQARATRGRPSSSALGLTHASYSTVRQRLSTALLRAEMTSLRRLAISYDSGLRGDADGYAAARARRDDAVGLAEEEEVKCFTPLPRPGEWAGDREATGLTVQYLFYSTAHNNTAQDRTVLGRHEATLAEMA